MTEKKICVCKAIATIRQIKTNTVTKIQRVLPLIKETKHVHQKVKSCASLLTCLYILYNRL